MPSCADRLLPLLLLLCLYLAHTHAQINYINEGVDHKYTKREGSYRFFMTYELYKTWGTLLVAIDTQASPLATMNVYASWTNPDPHKDDNDYAGSGSSFFLSDALNVDRTLLYINVNIKGDGSQIPFLVVAREFNEPYIMHGLSNNTLRLHYTNNDANAVVKWNPPTTQVDVYSVFVVSSDGADLLTLITKVDTQTELENYVSKRAGSTINVTSTNATDMCSEWRCTYEYEIEASGRQAVVVMATAGNETVLIGPFGLFPCGMDKEIRNNWTPCLQIELVVPVTPLTVVLLVMFCLGVGLPVSCGLCYFGAEYAFGGSIPWGVDPNPPPPEELYGIPLTSALAPLVIVPSRISPVGSLSTEAGWETESNSGGSYSSGYASGERMESDETSSGDLRVERR